MRTGEGSQGERGEIAQGSVLESEGRESCPCGLHQRFSQPGQGPVSWEVGVGVWGVGVVAVLFFCKVASGACKKEGIERLGDLEMYSLKAVCTQPLCVLCVKSRNAMSVWH